MSNTEPIGISPQQALKLMHEDPRCVLVDIRSSMEFLFVGHPKGAVHVPWIDEPDWTVSPDFVTDIRKLLLGGAVCTVDDACAPVILICRSGKRSLEAASCSLSRILIVYFTSTRVLKEIWTTITTAVPTTAGVFMGFPGNSVDSLTPQCERRPESVVAACRSVSMRNTVMRLR